MARTTKEGIPPSHSLVLRSTAAKLGVQRNSQSANSLHNGVGPGVKKKEIAKIDSIATV